MKNIVLIGGSYGIGHAIVTELQEDHKIFVASRTAEGLEKTNATHIPFDASTDTLDETQIPDRIHGFVYCPGSITLKPFKRLDQDAFRKDMEINFFSLVKVVSLLLPKMTEGASLVFFSTVAVSLGMPFHTSIAAAKGAIEGFAKSLAAEYAPKLRVNVIAPSLTDTALANRLLSTDKKRDIMAQRHPLNKVGTPEDVGHIATFLLSDKSSWITGQVLGIDGGISTLNTH